MKKGKILLSGLLSVTMFGLFTNVNADSYISNDAPNEITTKPIIDEATNTGYFADPLHRNYDLDAVLANTTIASLVCDDGDGGSTECGDNVIDYHDVDGRKLFCLNRIKQYGDKSVYKKDSEISDYPIIYIISNAQDYYNKTLASAQINSENSNFELSWMTQVAIWQYLDPTKFIATNLDNNIQDAIFQYDSAHPYYYSQRAQELWNRAKVYDKDGNEITDTNAVTATSFYLVFPIDNVDEYSFDFDINASSDGYTYYTGYKYVTKDGSDYQPLALVTKNTKNISGAINFKGSHIDDTASLVSRSVYLVGFLILIAGVGIIYVNAKPQKQQI